MKEAAHEFVWVALRRVLAGGIYPSEAVDNTRIQQQLAGKAPLMADPIDRQQSRTAGFTPSGNDLRTRELAEFLVLITRTIESHRQRAKQKLNLDRHSAHAIRDWRFSESFQRTIRGSRCVRWCRSEDNEMTRFSQLSVPRFLPGLRFACGNVATGADLLLSWVYGTRYHG
jgi:hypothetical protein